MAEAMKVDRLVSVRDLARRSGKLIDEVERDGLTLALGRYGRVVALVIPLPERATIDLERTARSDGFRFHEEEADSGGDDLGPHERAIFEVALESRTGAISRETCFAKLGLSFGDFALVWLGLEQGGYIDRDRPMLTKKGLRAARRFSASG